MRVTLATLALAITWLPSTGLAQAQAPAAPPRPTSVGTAVDVSMGSHYQRLRKYLVATVEKMPDDSFGLRPSDGARTFAETAAHIAASNLAMCAGAQGRPSTREQNEARLAASTTKAAIVSLLNQGFAECDAVFATPGDDRFATTRALLVIHSWEVYGTMAVYLRMKGIVPPTTEDAQKRGSGGSTTGR